MSIVIRDEKLDSPVALDLITRLNAELDARYPEPGANHFRLDPDEVAPGRGAFVVALDDDRASDHAPNHPPNHAPNHAIGCGAFRVIEAGTAEIKRMFVDPSARGRKVGAAILDALESRARALGVTRLVLETGDRQHEAIGLYERAGYRRVPPFGEYVGSPLSVCMAKDVVG